MPAHCASQLSWSVTSQHFLPLCNFSSWLEETSARTAIAIRVSQSRYIFVTKYYPLNDLGLSYLDFALDAEIDVSLHWVIFRGFHCTPTMITYDHKLIFTYLKNVDARRLCTHAYSMPLLTFLPKSSQNFIRHQHSRGQT